MISACTNTHLFGVILDEITDSAYFQHISETYLELNSTVKFYNFPKIFFFLRNFKKLNTNDRAIAHEDYETQKGLIDS